MRGCAEGDLTRVVRHGEGLIGQVRAEILPQVVLAARALEHQDLGGPDTLHAAERLGHVVRELLLGRQARARRGQEREPDQRNEMCVCS